jgi:hypothetical protein
MTRGIDAPTIKRLFKLERPAADVLRPTIQKLNLRIFGEGLRGLGRGRAVDQDMPTQNERVCPFACLREPTLDQQNIQPPARVWHTVTIAEPLVFGTPFRGDLVIRRPLRSLASVGNIIPGEMPRSSGRRSYATYSSRYSRNLCFSLGCRILLSAADSIWRMRSLVTPSLSAISPRVCSRPPSRP